MEAKTLKFFPRPLPDRFTEPTLPKDKSGKVMRATFICGKKYPHMRVILESVQEEVHPTSQQASKIAGTGVMIRFNACRFATANLSLAQLLIKSKLFRAPGDQGFDIDPEDPTGFWRYLGLASERVVKTFAPGERTVVDALKILDEEPDEKNAPKPADRMVRLEAERVLVQ